MQSEQAQAADLIFKDSVSFWAKGAWHWTFYCARTTLTSPIAFIFDVAYAPMIVIVASTSIVQNSVSGRTFLTASMAFLAVLASALVSLAGLIVGHKERHLLKRFRASPMPTSALIFGFIAGSAVPALLSAILAYMVAHWFFGVPWPANIGLTAISWFAALLVIALMAVILSSFMRRVKTVTSMVMPLFFVIIGISGLFYPIKLSPKWLQVISWLSPTRPASDWFITSATNSSFVSMYGWEPILLVGWILGLFIVAVRYFKWD